MITPRDIENLVKYEYVEDKEASLRQMYDWVYGLRILYFRLTITFLLTIIGCFLIALAKGEISFEPTIRFIIGFILALLTCLLVLHRKIIKTKIEYIGSIDLYNERRAELKEAK